MRLVIGEALHLAAETALAQAGYLHDLPSASLGTGAVFGDIVGRASQQGQILLHVMMVSLPLCRPQSLQAQQA